MEKVFPATMVADRYRILEPIGAGGMGVVFKAHDQILDIAVAIKMIDSDETGKAAARLQREATAAGRLLHKSIARIFDFGQTEDGRPYMVMEMLSGSSLAELIKEKRLIPCVEAIPIFIQIAQGLSYAHNNNIIHRDLKPSNIMLVDQINGDRLAKILDFGIAKFMDENLLLTQKGSVVGSPLYMSPQQAQGEEATIQSDIYSFGCLMFETLTGEPPFKAASAIETLYMHRNVAAPLLTDLISVQRLPRDLVELVDECLHKIPENRPVDFKQIESRLSDMQETLLNKALTVELKQHISDQHFKIKLFHFWKSKFAMLGAVAIFIALSIMGVAIFNSEQKRVSENKSLTSSHSEIKSPLAAEAGSGAFPGTVKFGLAIKKYAKELVVTSDASCNDDSLKRVKDLKINRLELNDGNFNGSGLQHIQMNHLRSLSLLNSHLDDANLNNISRFPNLQTLKIGSNQVTNKGIAYLEDLPSLACLRIQSTSITGDIINSLIKVKGLTNLSLADVSLDANIGRKIAEIKTLNSLELINSGEISNESFESLSTLHLSNLSIEKINLDETAFKSIAKMRELVILHIGQAKFEPASLKHLSNTKSLACIDFSGNKQISDELIENLIPLKVHALNFSFSNISEKQFLALSKMKELYEIHLKGCKISDESAEFFRQNYKRLFKHDCQVEVSIVE